MASYPTTVAACHKMIEELRAEYKIVTDMAHELKNECAVILSNKELAFRDKCLRCRGSRL